MTKRTGFTLVELLVVISLIGILSAVGIAVINPAKMMGKSRDARRKSDLKAIQGAIELFYSQNRRYPNKAEVNFGGAMTLKKPCTPPGTEVYMNNVPQDPLNASGTGWRYWYRSYNSAIHVSDTAVCTGDISNPSYLLCSCVEDVSNNNNIGSVFKTDANLPPAAEGDFAYYCFYNCHEGSFGSPTDRGGASAGYYGVTNPF